MTSIPMACGKHGLPRVSLRGPIQTATSALGPAGGTSPNEHVAVTR